MKNAYKMTPARLRSRVSTRARVGVACTSCAEHQHRCRVTSGETDASNIRPIAGPPAEKQGTVHLLGRNCTHRRKPATDLTRPRWGLRTVLFARDLGRISPRCVHSLSRCKCSLHAVSVNNCTCCSPLYSRINRIY